MANQIPQKLMATTIKRIIKTHDKRARDRLHAFSEVGALAVPPTSPATLAALGSRRVSQKETWSGGSH